MEAVCCNILQKQNTAYRLCLTHYSNAIKTCYALMHHSQSMHINIRTI